MKELRRFAEKPRPEAIGAIAEIELAKLANKDANVRLLFERAVGAIGESTSFYKTEDCDRGGKSDLAMGRLSGHRRSISGISVKSGTTTSWAQVKRATLESAIRQGLAPSEGSLSEAMKGWLLKKGTLSVVKAEIEAWYGSRWSKILEECFFGTEFGKAPASILALADLKYSEKTGVLSLRRLCVLNRGEALSLLNASSPGSGVSLKDAEMNSGFMWLKRAGGSNGGPGANDWQMVFSRKKMADAASEKFGGSILEWD